MPKGDPRVVDSTGALEMGTDPKRMLVLGGGIIGLEMGTVYSTLGARLDVVEMLDGLMQGADRDLVKVWQKMNAPRFDNIMLKTKTVGAEATKEGIKVTFEGENAPKEPQVYDLVLQAVGRSPNGKKIGAEKAGVTVSDRGFIPVDIQMRTNVPHIFAIGDIVGQPMLAHKAVHEAHVAAEVIAGEQKGDKELSSAAFNARVIPSVAYTDPEVAWVGLTEDQAKAEGIKVKKGHFPWTRFGPRHRQRPRRGLHQAAVRCRDAPHPGRRHRRHACGRHDRRDRAGHRDGRGRDRHRQDDPPAPDAGRKHRHGGGSGARHLHRPAAGEEGRLIEALSSAHKKSRRGGIFFVLVLNPGFRGRAISRRRCGRWPLRP
jgi:pyruvate/2-oxoglutarate dehydrogenase complex dihydrolipoamide dehydrogenase (E3) component